MTDIKTNINQIPVVNKRLYKETAGMNKVEPAVVKDIVEHIGKFIHDTIKRGMMETVMINDFGKFRPKTKILIAMYKKGLNEGNNMRTMSKLLAGRKIKTKDK